TRLKLLYEGLGNGLHNDILPLGFDGMCDVLHSIAGGEEEKIASMMSWLESEGSKGDHPEVAKVLLMCGRLNQHVLNRAKRTQHEEAITKNKNAAEGEKIPEVVPAEVPALED